jgi:hypothetical protein
MKSFNLIDYSFLYRIKNIQKKYRKMWAQRGTYKINQSQWSSFVCSPLEGTIPHLEFSIEIQSNNLTYQGNAYIERQQYLYKLIKSVHAL